MQQPTNRAAPEAAPRTALDGLIAEAEAATGMLPPYDRCVQLRDTLVTAIGRLADQVRREQGYLADGTADWRQCERALLQAQGALCGDLGRGLQSAADHVHVLGEAARALDACIRATR
ncbi:DUF6415 family natural product biosynthesis protein [Streptomyces sp. NBC_01239]|uniref:DUF6415 family natural product biosynthesis protein n=1 Tax=Streptomyces sp. NBC_01239 TaxID=2903792 RepID=UPI0022561CC9|nr:DUF6415 family natural product biosynthesis protein [Streptomyces sp. NBC_01239]MCX4816802.1 DUF6415 family natural product biosynthesis protein [Streptomyces sp. NBC_01239]MCX4818250.1 DUF6415 family natural product biosynthesis protein [Streptomyces sp. NBC_01239]